MAEIKQQNKLCRISEDFGDYISIMIFGVFRTLLCLVIFASYSLCFSNSNVNGVVTAVKNLFFGPEVKIFSYCLMFTELLSLIFLDYKIIIFFFVCVCVLEEGGREVGKKRSDIFF